MKRILSLLPSATEVIAALGLIDHLVGRSHECDLPPQVQRLPVVTSPQIDPEAPSGAIDSDVRRLVRDGLSVYRVDAERLRATAPDLIVSQTQCDVCAVTPADLEAALGALQGSQHPVQILALEPHRLGDVLEDFARIGAACGVPERGAALRDAERRRLDAITRRAGGGAARPRVACLEWIDPIMGSGSWIPELIAKAGGHCVLGEAGGKAERISGTELAACDPDVIAIAPCGFDVERTRRELAPLVGMDGWRQLRAVRDGRVYLLDGLRHINRPGPRIAESAEIFAEILWPENFHLGHRGEAWRPLGATGAGLD